MLVDLIRNDLGRVAKFGSVSVSEFMVTERYSHVMHLVSQVEAQLADGVTWRQVFESMFPGGTITGCPKIRTMAIIEELEPVARGYYTGALGWISYEGNMTFNIIIRSILLQNGIAYVQSGAGIVADSEPEREYDEVCRKAEALWQALEQCEQRVNPMPPQSTDGPAPGFFETFRSHRSMPVLWPYHERRILAACARAGIIVPENFLVVQPELLSRRMDELRRQHGQDDGVFRYVIDRESGDGPPVRTTRISSAAIARTRISELNFTP